MAQGPGFEVKGHRVPKKMPVNLTLMGDVHTEIENILDTAGGTQFVDGWIDRRTETHRFLYGSNALRP